MGTLIGENHNIPLGFMQIMRNRLVSKLHENESPKVITNYLKIDTLAPWRRIFMIFDGFWRRLIFHEFFIGSRSAKNAIKFRLFGANGGVLPAMPAIFVIFCQFFGDQKNFEIRITFLIFNIFSMGLKFWKADEL